MRSLFCLSFLWMFTQSSMAVAQQPDVNIACWFSKTDGSAQARTKIFAEQKDSYEKTQAGIKKLYNNLREGDFILSAWADNQTGAVELGISHIDFEGFIAVANATLSKDHPSFALDSPAAFRTIVCELRKTEKI